MDPRPSRSLVITVIVQVVVVTIYLVVVGVTRRAVVAVVSSYSMTAYSLDTS